MGALDDAPEELRVRTDLDGFRCVVRPYDPPEGLLLLFLPLWWAAWMGFMMLSMRLDPSLADIRITNAPAWVYLAWPTGALGWAPAFMVWRARRRRRTMALNLDPGRLTVGRRSWAVGDIVSVEEVRSGVRLRLRRGRGRGRVPMRSNSTAARRWVARQIRDALPSDAPAPPEALQAMRGESG